MDRSNPFQQKSQQDGRNSGPSDCDDIIFSLGRFSLGKDGTFRPTTAAPVFNDLPSSSSSSVPVQEVPPTANDDLNSKNIICQHLMAQLPYDAERSYCESMLLARDRSSVGGSQFGGGGYDLNAHNTGMMNIMQAGMSIPNYSSSCNYVNQIDRSAPLNNGLMSQRQFPGTGNNGLSFGYENIDNTTSMYSATCGDIWQRKQYGYVDEILKSGHYDQIDVLVYMLQGSIPSLMTNPETHSLFHDLVNVCEGHQLDVLAKDIFRAKEFLVKAAFDREGSRSIVKLVKKLRKTVHAFTMTEILSTWLYDIMTNSTAKVVIQQCLNIFGPGPNKILYEKVISHFQDLAIHKVGCRSLNECIDAISGEHRARLLHSIAHASDSLSHDPYGNYVVQHVLDLKNKEVTIEILNRLKGQFVLLSLKKGGSHVVEKCIENSTIGLICVVKEIVGYPKAAIQLARDQFGNYVIQKALSYTMEQGYTDLHKSLLESLVPYQKALLKTAGGKSVLNLIRHSIRFLELKHAEADIRYREHSRQGML